MKISFKKYNQVMKEYQDDVVTQYCVDVLQGRIITGKAIILACLRHMNDLVAMNEATFPFYYDREYALSILRFASLVPNVDTGKPFELAPFQKWILGSVIGWRSKRTGGKRFKREHISMSRTNSKTDIGRILASYDLFLGTPEFSREILVASNITAQADKLFGYCKMTVQELMKTKPFSVFKNVINPIYDRINYPSKNTKLIRLSAEGGKADSYHATLAIFDEYAEQMNRKFVNKLSSGQVQMDEALLLTMGTAGDDPRAPMMEEEKAMLKNLEYSPEKVATQFIAVYRQDNDEEVWQPETWEKSNPLLCVASIRNKLLDGLITERDALLGSGQLPDFLVKNMNRWQNSKDGAFISLKQIQSIVTPHFLMKGQPVYIGFDASQTGDDTAFGFVFPYTNTNNEERFHIMQHSFIPTREAGGIVQKEEKDGIEYRKLSEKGLCDITKDRFGLIDEDDLYNWIMKFVADNELVVIGFFYDAYHATRLIKRLEANTNWLLVPVRQGTLSLNDPTKFLRDGIISEKITSFDDSLLATSFTNAIVKSDNNGIQVDKNRRSLKIDVADAIIDCFYQAMYHFEDASLFDGNAELDRMTNQQLNDFFKSDAFSF